MEAVKVMWRNYMVIAWRALWKSKVYAAVNITGLLIGMAGALLIFLLVPYELGYERWLPNADAVYQIRGASKHPSGEWYYNPLTQASLKIVLEEAVPEFQEVTRIHSVRQVVESRKDSFFEDVSKVDPNFFTIFDIAMAQGSNALPDLSTVLISQNLAQKYFGTQSPLGQSLTLDDEQVVKVGGVFYDLPQNTHLKLNLIARLDESALPTGLREPPTVAIYARTTPDTDMSFFDSRQTAIVEDHFADWARPGERISDSLRLTAMRLTDLHLHAKSREGLPDPMTWLYAFSTAAALLLAVAAANFVNLCTSRAITRAREISLRQSLGARSPDLIAQFLGETLLIVVLALGLALVLVELIRPWLATYLMQPALNNVTFADSNLIAAPVALVIVMTLAAGLYPALYLARIHPARRLSSRMGARPSLARTVLVTFQYAVAAALALVTMIFFTQVRHLNTLDISFERHGLLALQNVTLHQNAQFRERLGRELAQLGSVEAVTMTGGLEGLPFGQLREVRLARVAGQTSGDTVLDVVPIDFDFFQTLKTPMLAGRMISDTFLTDTLRWPPGTPADGSAEVVTTSASVVINAAAAQALGFGSPEEALGSSFGISVQPGVNAELTVVGVSADLLWFSARSDVFPTIYYRNESALQHMLVRVSLVDVARAQEEIVRVWSQLSPDIPLTRFWVEDRYDQLYAAEVRQLRLFSSFAVLVLVTATIGLYGLAAWEAQTKAREIGIRKSMGARSRDILWLLLWRFTKPVILANLIAIPVVAYFMRYWLEGFVQRVDLSPLLFFLTVTGFLVVAWAAILSQVFGVVRTPPARVLREAG
jgi:putative ABC transport system permease protein